MEVVAHYPYTNEALRRANRSKTNYYEISAYDEYWGSAYLISIEKHHTKDPNEAIVWQLLRMVSEQEKWNNEAIENITATEFLNFIFNTGGYLHSEKGFDFPVNDFWTEYETILNGISNCENHTIIKNGNSSALSEFLKKDEIMTTICFFNSWNCKEFFIETQNNWWFFDWGMTV